MSDDTIFALSSGALPAGIAVVRLSGSKAGDALRHLIGSLPPPRRASLRTLRHEGTPIDRAMVLWLPGPSTATGEDIAELHLHGGRAVVAAAEAALATLPALRRAEPGEFTRRALYNGCIDLTAAEGLADLLEAETEVQRRAALAMSGGALARSVEAWRRRLVEAAALVEAGIDLAAEDETASIPLPVESIAALCEELEQALARPAAERLRDGIRVVFAGPVNAGKSSLVNALAEREVAIATPIPGTTRDLIEVPVAISGIPFLLTDSAGLRATDDPVEAMGVERARRALAEADIVVWLDDGDFPAESPGIAIWPRCDLPGRRRAPAGRLLVSVVTGEGLDRLKEMLISRASALLPRADELTLNQRHRSSIKHCIGELRAALNAASEELLVAEHLRAATIHLQMIVGGGGIDELLDAVFARFCVGK